jgi:prepilin-type N-terminal cleavage/methylation domain-containing protein
MFAYEEDGRTRPCKPANTRRIGAKDDWPFDRYSRMFASLAQRLRARRGFTLIELIVTVLLLTILAAIALPAYMEHQKKGKDSDAQSNARNLVSRIELCFATEEDYTNCDSNAELGSDTNLPYGTTAGQVSVVSATTTTFKVTAVSKAQSDGTNHTFTVDHGVSGVNDRTCTAGSSNKKGGCRSGVW